MATNAITATVTYTDIVYLYYEIIDYKIASKTFILNLLYQLPKFIIQFVRLLNRLNKPEEKLKSSCLQFINVAYFRIVFVDHCAVQHAVMFLRNYNSSQGCVLRNCKVVL